MHKLHAWINGMNDHNFFAEVPLISEGFKASVIRTKLYLTHDIALQTKNSISAIHPAITEIIKKITCDTSSEMSAPPNNWEKN